MFNFIKGATVPSNAKIKEEYEVDDEWICANVSAEKIIALFKTFMKNEKPQPLGFCLFLEIPASQDDETVVGTTENGLPIIEKTHKDIYYLDGIDGEYVTLLLDTFGEWFVNDGLSAFGILNQNGNEIGKYKYNVIKFHTIENAEKYTCIFEKHGIKRTEDLVTAWDFISRDNPGVSDLYKKDGKTIYDLVDVLKEIGLYKAEQREED